MQYLFFLLLGFQKDKDIKNIIIFFKIDIELNLKMHKYY